MGVNYLLMAHAEYALRERNGLLMLATALGITGVRFVAAKLLLKGEDMRAQRTNLSLLYHAIAVAIAVIGWLAAYTLLEVFQPIDLAWIGAVGGGGLAAHWLRTRNRTKGIDTKEAFL